MGTNTRSAWMVAGAGTLWGLISLFVHALQADGLTSLQIVFFRNLLAAVILGGIIAAKERKFPRFRLRDIWMFLGTGMISIALFNYCYFAALERSSVAVASLLLYTSPIFIMVLSAVLFHERLTGQKLLSLALTVAGCACITGVFSESQAVAWTTVLLGLGSGLFYGLYSIFGKYALREYNAMTVSFYTFVFAAAATAPFCGADSFRFVAAHPQDLLVGIGLAVVSTVAPFLLYTAGLNGIQASKAAVLAIVEPLVASLLGVIAFGDSFTVWTLLGMVLIFSAIAVLQLPWHRKAEQLHG